jgi:hypothetical protein
LNEGLDSPSDYRVENKLIFRDQIAGQAGSKIDESQLNGSRRTERFNKEAGLSELRDSTEEAAREQSFHYESQPKSVFEGADEASFALSDTPDAPHRQDNKRLLKPSLSDGWALAAPVEEDRKTQTRKKAGQEDTNGEFNLPGSGLASREYEEAGRIMAIETGKLTAGKSEIIESEVPSADGSGSYANTGFDFLGHYQQTQDLQFQQAAGYWANNYIPGDPEIRLLSARLAQWDRSWLEDNAALEQDVEPVKQPFDAPADSALALSLMADARSVSADGISNSPTRMRLQVGIRGIEQRRGQRPAMNVGVVVDLPADATDEVRIAARALLDAMLQSKQAGDRFSLLVTGQKDEANLTGAPGLVVPANDFRFGSLELAKQLILGQEYATANDGGKTTLPNLSPLSLYEAMERAGAMVKQTDDPSRPLGSSSVLLISAREIQDIDRLAALAHERAQDGITLSVIPLGNQPRNNSVEQLVLAGLGNRRYLETPGRAPQLIEEELHTSSRAVARAARLSIRLAPGVQLIDVVGSERLDTDRAQRVREIENSMDRRLNANLGIQADRGEDEGGIQIVVPSIYSGDSVTVLLDIVTDRPGAIAEVSLRYKDLVFLRNGSLRAHLDLPRREMSGAVPNRGPAQLTVMKNLLSHHFVKAVERAAAALGRQQPGEAAAILRAMHATISQARQALPEWASDKDLINDQQVLDRYIAALASPRAGAHQSFLADSLHYAAWAKIHRPLEEWKQ